MASCRTWNPVELQISPKPPQKNVSTLCNWTVSDREPKCWQRTWRCQGFFPHWGKMESSSILRGKFSGKDIEEVPVPSAWGSVCRAKACAPVLCSHLSPAAALCYLVQEDGFHWMMELSSKRANSDYFYFINFCRKNQPNGQEPLKRQGSTTSKTPVLTPQAIKHIWVRTALIEKVLDKIVQYIVDNCR